ncbi:hypothetical protein EYF80_057450 [Liparis tanakae]|uniref:Uncharacterized protein n=1 Tax=Liparis tanakae TaxID=230148 RepID=A0A4Z2EUF3_9TELE|nr:hypothetical protein EYF80_057450 [Liparis tanakae]
MECGLSGRKYYLQGSNAYTACGHESSDSSHSAPLGPTRREEDGAFTFSARVVFEQHVDRYFQCLRDEGEQRRMTSSSDGAQRPGGHVRRGVQGLIPGAAALECGGVRRGRSAHRSRAVGRFVKSDSNLI